MIQARDSLLYGMTSAGGTPGKGIIFSYNITSGDYNILHDFGSDSDGAVPNGSLIQASDNLLYGMTSSGGSGGGGIIFSYNIASDAYTVLHNFGNGNDGRSPFATLLQASDGLLYGTTSAGGASDSGTVFNYNILSATETVIHNFTGGSADGKNPQCSLIEINDTTAGINRLSIDNKLLIFPNPSTGRFTIQLPGHTESYTAYIGDVLNHTIRKLVLSDTQSTIDLSDEPAGMYYIYLKSEKDMLAGKVIITK